MYNKKKRGNTQLIVHQSSYNRIDTYPGQILVLTVFYFVNDRLVECDSTHGKVLIEGIAYAYSIPFLDPSVVDFNWTP